MSGLGFSPKQRGANRQHVTVFNSGAAAGDVTEEWVLLAVHLAATVHEVAWIPHAAVTGQDTNTFHLNVINAGADGVGNANDVEVGNVDFTSGNDASADQETSLATDFGLDADDVLVVQRELVGTGLAMPEGTFLVEFTVTGEAPVL